MREPIYCQGKLIGFLEDKIFKQDVGPRSTFNNLNSKGMDVKEVHRSLNGRCNWWLLTFSDKSQVKIKFSDVAKVGKIKVHGKGVGSQYMVNYSFFDDARPKLQSDLDIPKADVCYVCGSMEKWFRPDSNLGGPGEWLCSRCHPKPKPKGEK